VGAHEPLLRRDGRIPFRLRIGVTGHRTLEPEPWLVDVVRTQTRRIRDLLPRSASTAVRLTVVSQLAEGADRLVVHEVLEDAQDRGEEARLEAVLPMPRDEYSRQQRFSLRSDDEFDQLLERAVTVDEPADSRPADNLGRAYEDAGDRLIGRCDVLVVLWNGAETGGRGGTAETLLRAAAWGKPCIWISTTRPTVEDNLTPGSSEAFFHRVAELAHVPQERAPRPAALDGSTLESVQEAFRALDKYNRAGLPRGGFEQRLDRVLGDDSSASSEWVAPFFLRASLLAESYQRKFRGSAWFLALLATGAAAMLGLAVSSSQHTWAWLELGLLAMLVGAWYYLMKYLDFHSRWLSYRVLAERLRSARYLAPTGARVDPTAGLRPVYAQRAGWLDRAFEEVWDGTPAPPRSEAELPRLRLWLAEEWIGGQIQYHARAVRQHKRWALILIATVIFLFVATMVLAFLHALDIGTDKVTFFAITLPAAAASLGVMLTLGQHRALAEGSALMRSNLAVAQRDILDADASTLARTSAEAAQVIAAESGDWFGALWLTNMEHPP